MTSEHDAKVIDYLDKPPQRYAHVFQKASGSREMVEDPEGDWVKFEDMDLYMFEGAQLMNLSIERHEKLRDGIRALQVRCCGTGKDVCNGCRALRELLS